jgi:hypothetical protein
MSGDTLVIKISENNTSTLEDTDHRSAVGTTYVFYDYKKELFGVRCGYVKRNGKTVTFSYYVDNKEVLLDFLLEFIYLPKEAEITLVNYPDLPKESDDITYELLRKYDQDENEISGYTHNEDDDDEEEEEDDVFPNKELVRFLNIIESVYNTY